MKTRTLTVAILGLACLGVALAATSVLAFKPLGHSPTLPPAGDGAATKDEFPIITATRIQTAPKIDGVPDGEWCGTHASADFKLQDGEAPKGETRFNIAYDDKNLYVLVVCPESEAELKSLKADAIQELPEDVWADDSVELFIDPTGNRQSYYQLIANSKGVHWEGYHATANYPSPWNAHAQVAAASNGKDCWAVEFAIPFSAFENTQKFADEWAFNVVHSRIGPNECLQWSPVHGSSNHAPERFGKLRGMPAKK